MPYNIHTVPPNLGRYGQIPVQGQQRKGRGLINTVSAYRSTSRNYLVSCPIRRIRSSHQPAVHSKDYTTRVSRKHLATHSSSIDNDDGWKEKNSKSIVFKQRNAMLKSKVSKPGLLILSLNHLNHRKKCALTEDDELDKTKKSTVREKQVTVQLS
jgi:hypothetical protein